MKLTIFSSVILFAFCLFSGVTGRCNYNGKQLSVGEHVIDCETIVTCSKSGDISAVSACPPYQCENITGWKEKDLSKPYPECCGGPICG